MNIYVVVNEIKIQLCYFNVIHIFNVCARLHNVNFDLYLLLQWHTRNF